MRRLLTIMLLSAPFASFSAHHDSCTSSWRVGQRVVKVGDDVGRALESIDRASHRMDWLRGPRGSKWTLVTTGYNQKTIQIKIKNGRLKTICQHQ